jgi:predicted metal-dependent phosphoesterase TrpH
MNILWYNFDDTDPRLHELLRGVQIRRRQNTRKILEKLIKLGFVIDINKILDKYNHYVPLNHIVDDVKSIPKNLRKIKKELGMNNPREGHIIGEYFKNKKIGKLYESYIDINRVLELKKEIGGQVILNHPAKHGYISPEVWKELKVIGVEGVEVLSPHHSIDSVMYIQYLARQVDFIETGGSDYHRFEGEKYPIQSSFDYFKIDSKYLKGINKIIF